MLWHLGISLPLPHPSLFLITFSNPFWKRKLKKTTFSLNADKAPRPDWFNFHFFQKFWHLVCNDLIDIFQSFDNNNMDMLCLTLAYITLIPKIEGQMNRKTLDQNKSP